MIITDSFVSPWFHKSPDVGLQPVKIWGLAFFSVYSICFFAYFFV